MLTSPGVMLHTVILSKLITCKYYLHNTKQQSPGWKMKPKRKCQNLKFLSWPPEAPKASQKLFIYPSKQLYIQFSTKSQPQLPQVLYKTLQSYRQSEETLMRKHLATVGMKTSFLTGRYFHLLWGEGRKTLTGIIKCREVMNTESEKR